MSVYCHTCKYQFICLFDFISTFTLRFQPDLSRRGGADDASGTGDPVDAGGDDADDGGDNDAGEVGDDDGGEDSDEDDYHFDQKSCIILDLTNQDNKVIICQ